MRLRKRVHTAEAGYNSRMSIAPLNQLLDDLEDAGKLDDPLEVLAGFSNWATSTRRALYPHQEEAATEIFAGHHVIAATPTGSGKSMIALTGHLAALAKDQRSYYTAPIKALVSEKFFDLVELFGARNVGMITGDISLNAEAPIICCTAEILANQSLRDGAQLDAGVVIMDEFHFYGDPERGWAWQVPLLELPNVQFVLMSATLGNVDFFIRDLQARSGREVALVDGASRPVPLEMEYSEDDSQYLLESLVKAGRWPIYLVHFGQNDAVKTAAGLASANLLDREKREKIAAHLKGVHFTKGFGQTLSRLLRLGVGVHHAGMLPRYRLLVEQLAQRGLLAVICGTDTLGVGINVPIRTVVFTSLVKFDGRRQRHLSAREFHQIAGRAGRAGFDTMGFVVVQAPPEVIETKKLAAKGQKRKGTSSANSQKPKVSWGRSTFERLVAAQPEALRSHFRIDHSLALNVLSGKRDSGEHLLWLARNNHDAPQDANPHLRRLGQVYSSLKQAEVVRHLPAEKAGSRGRLVLTHDLPEDFALNQPLSPFALAALELLDPDSPDYALDLVSIVESVLEDPRQVLIAQQKAQRDQVYQKLRSEGVEYHQRQEILEETTWPQPLKDLISGAFKTFAHSNPWVYGSEPSPKSVVRYLVENTLTFTQFISRFELARSEGVVLRYLTDAYRALGQIVPPEKRNEDFDQLLIWLGNTVKGVDSSLLDEWEALANGKRRESLAEDAEEEPAFGSGENQLPSANPFALRRQFRNAAWRRVEAIAFDSLPRLAACQDLHPDGTAWSDEDRGALLDDYWERFEDLTLDQGARASSHAVISEGDQARELLSRYLPADSNLLDGRKVWALLQEVDDGSGLWEWRMLFALDIAKTDASGELQPYLVTYGDIT